MGSGVAARGDKQGEEEGEGEGGLDHFLVVVDCPSRDDIDANQGHEPGDASGEHAAGWCFEERGFERANGGPFLDVFGGFFDGEFEHVVGGYDADENALRVDHRQSEVAGFLHSGDGCSFWIEGVEGDGGTAEQLGDAAVWGFEDEASEAEFVDEAIVGVGDVDHVDGFGLWGLLTNGVDGLGDGHFGPDGGEVGRHQAADAVFWVAEEHEGFLAVFGTEQVEEALRGVGGEFLEEEGAVVGAEVGEQSAGFLFGEFAQEILLFFVFEEREGVGGEVAGQAAVEQGVFGGSEFVEEVGDLGGFESFGELFESGPVSIGEAAFDT